MNEKDTATNEFEPEIIYLQYQGEFDSQNENIILEITDDSREKLETKENLDENSMEIEPNAALCVETQYDSSELSNAVHSIDGSETEIKLFDLADGVRDSPVYEDPYTCQPQDANPLNSYPCKFCTLKTGCIFCLKSHFESVHLNLGVIQYQCLYTLDFANASEICPKCNLVCPNKDELVDHRKFHFVSCELCDTTFDSPLYLSNHCKTTHQKFEVILSCDLCNQWFKDLYMLSEHYEGYHEMIVCIVCFKRFETKRELEAHRGSHKIVMQPEKVLPFACSKCDKGFELISELSQHVKKHPRDRGKGSKEKRWDKGKRVKK